MSASCGLHLATRSHPEATQERSQVFILRYTASRCGVPGSSEGMRAFGIFAFLLAASMAVSAQVSDQKAVALGQAATYAMSGGSTITDITLTGSANRNDGTTTLSGPIVLKATATHISRVDFSVSTDAAIEFRDSSTRIPKGSIVDGSGAIHEMAIHNCWSDVSWFAPLLSLLANSAHSNLIFRYVGTEVYNGMPVDHIRIKRHLRRERPEVGVLVSKLSATDILLDRSSELPLVIRYNTHPETNASLNIPAEVEFSAYQKIASGQTIPFRVTRRQGGVTTDVQVVGAAINSGVPVSNPTAR